MTPDLPWLVLYVAFGAVVGTIMWLYHVTHRDRSGLWRPTGNDLQQSPDDGYEGT